MNGQNLNHTSFYFADTWVRFMGAGHFSLAEYGDEMNERALR